MRTSTGLGCFKWSPVESRVFKSMESHVSVNLLKMFVSMNLRKNTLLCIYRNYVAHGSMKSEKAEDYSHSKMVGEVVY